MNSGDIENCFKKAMEAVNKASEIVLRGFKGKKLVEFKTAYETVTEFDKATEECLIQFLIKEFPDYKVIGEESAPNKKLTNEPTWIIDPIDGTANYAHGDPHCAICVALSVNKEIVLGIISSPMQNQTFTAIKGKGAFLNGNKIHASKTKELKVATIGMEISFACVPTLFDTYTKMFSSSCSHVTSMRSIGSAALSQCMVAMGAWDGYIINHLYIWDVAAGSLIVTEAGGCVIDLDGGKFDSEKGRLICAGSESLAHKLVDIFKV